MAAITEKEKDQELRKDYIVYLCEISLEALKTRHNNGKSPSAKRSRNQPADERTQEKDPKTQLLHGLFHQYQGNLQLFWPITLQTLVQKSRLISAFVRL